MKEKDWINNVDILKKVRIRECWQSVMKKPAKSNGRRPTIGIFA